MRQYMKNFLYTGNPNGIDDNGKGIYMAVFPIDKLREYRARETWGNAYRHPQKYKLLTEERIEPPFVRSDYRK